MKKILLIDTFNFLHRAYHALPKTFRDLQGEPTNAVYGFTSMLLTIIDTVKPDYIVACLDGKEPTFREARYERYKAQRKPMGADLSIQIPKIFEILDAFEIHQTLLEGYEADDVIGTLAKKLSPNMEVVIASNDRDLWQLTGKNVVIMIPASGNKETLWLEKNEIEKRLGFSKELMVDYKGLRGDPSDNIPGVSGIGEVTAAKLIQQLGTIENIYNNLEKVNPPSLREKLAKSEEIAKLSKKLSTIDTGIPTDIIAENYALKEYNLELIAKVLTKFNFKSLLKRLEVNKEKKPEDNSQTTLF